MKTPAIVLAVAAALGTCAFAAAQPAPPPGPPHERGPGGPPHGPQMGPPLERVLDLTADQQKAVEALRKEEYEAMRPAMEQLRGLHEALRDALEAATPDPMTVGQAAIAVHAAEAQMKQGHAAYRERLLALLTDEQKQKLALFEKMMGPGSGPRPGRPPGPPPGAPQ